MTEPQVRCEHIAVVHHGADDLSRLLAPFLRRAADERAAVMLCVDAPSEARLRANLGSVCDSCLVQPADTRYASPGLAMAALNEFVVSSMASGASTVWSIGAIPLKGDGRDQKWIRYEQAVLAIYAAHPLRAICLYDAETTPVPIRDSVQRTHQSTSGQWIESTADQPGQPTVADQPARAADLILHDPTPQTTRAALSQRFASDLSPLALADLQLVASELVTNAILHGAPPVEIRVWREPTETVLHIHDQGANPIDRYADLRPRTGGEHGGFGLWTIGQLADSVDIARHPDGNKVTVFLARE